MRTLRMVSALALTVAGVFTLPVLADENKASQTPQASPAVVAPATPAKEPAKEPDKKPAPAPSQLQLKVGDANLRFGIMVQPQADFQQNLAGGYSQNLMIRRVRLLIGGQVTKTVFFFFETENSRLGAATTAGVKTTNTGFQTLDATAEWRPYKAFNLAGGLIRVPTSRDALESASSEFTMDFNTYAFMTTTALGGTGGRDTGIMARGYFLGDRLEYRAALLSGMRENGNRNTFRKVGRLQYNFFDKEVYSFPSYAGSNFGTKKIVAIGSAVDSQVDYTGLTADVFADIPTSFGSMLGTATYQNIDGGKRSPTALARQQIISVDGGIYLKKLKVGPWVRYEQRKFDLQTTRDEKRYIAGLNYYPMGNNFNIKTAVSHLKPFAGRSMNQLTVQLQIFYY